MRNGCNHETPTYVYFYVYILWLTGIIRMTYNDFHHKAGHIFLTQIRIILKGSTSLY